MTTSLRIHHIGNEQMEEGWNEYLLVSDLDGDIIPDDIQEHFLNHYYRDSYAPGGYFCLSMEVIPKPHNPSQAILIVHHRYDI